jgi:gliding motility-associated protein GldM
LFSQIDVGSFKFNKLEATVIPNTNYVIKGNEYAADIFIAASDSTTKPIVKIGKVTEIKDDKGEVVDYEMTGNYDSLPIENGMGKYKVSANSLGDKEYEGLIYLKKPMGGYIKRYFKRSYQVAQAQVVISPTKMNVFYSGLENPVEVSVPGVPPNKLSVSMSGGSIYKKGGAYVAKPTGRSRECVISVSAEINGEKKRMPSKTFRVKPVPDPIGSFAGTNGGNVRQSMLSTARYVIAELPDFLFDLKFRVVSFNMYTIVNGFTVEYPQTGNQVSNQQRDLLRNAKPGQRIVIEEIKVQKPDGTVAKLKGAISLKVTQ